MNTLGKFRLDGKIAVITGGAGLLGVKHATVIAEAGGIPVLWDVNEKAMQDCAKKMKRQYDADCLAIDVDITNLGSIRNGLKKVLKKFNKIDVLINNAANNPKMDGKSNPAWGRLENFAFDLWQKDISVGLTGAFLCSQVIGSHMAEHNGGIILNVASDLGVIAPDQRVYQRKGLRDYEQPVKPVTYSVVKHGIIGLTKYLATYWAHKSIRVNAISPGGIYAGQSIEFVRKLIDRIPLGRMANQDEYMAAVLFLVSDASAYMTGSNLVMDGGRTCW